MESSLFGGQYNTHVNMMWEWSGSRSQSYSWGVRGREGRAWRVKNRVFDEESNSAARTRFRSVIPEEGVTRERHSGVRDVLKEESFC